MPVFWPGPGGGNALMVKAALNPRWSQAPIDLSALTSLAGTLNLTAPSVTYQGTTVQNLDLAASLDGGTAKVDHLKGKLFGGTLDAKASLTAAGVIAANGTLAGLDLSRAGTLTGGAASGGQANGAFNLTARGRSEAEIISTLGGTLSFTGKNINVAALSSGKSGLGLGGMVSALNQLGGALGGPKQGKGLADVDAGFAVNHGVATAQKLRAVTNVGVATGAGTVDLPAWTVDLKGAIQPANNLLTAVLKGASSQTVNVPFTVSGALDTPRIKVDTSVLGAGGLQVPGLDKLLKKKGVGQVLEGILGGKTQQQQAPSQQQQQQQQQQPQQPQPASPADLLRGLLKKF